MAFPFSLIFKLYFFWKAGARDDYSTSDYSDESVLTLKVHRVYGNARTS